MKKRKKKNEKRKKKEYPIGVSIGVAPAAVRSSPLLPAVAVFVALLLLVRRRVVAVGVRSGCRGRVRRLGRPRTRTATHCRQSSSPSRALVAVAWRRPTRGHWAPVCAAAVEKSPGRRRRRPRPRCRGLRAPGVRRRTPDARVPLRQLAAANETPRSPGAVRVCLVVSSSVVVAVHRPLPSVVVVVVAVRQRQPIGQRWRWRRPLLRRTDRRGAVLT